MIRTAKTGITLPNFEGEDPGKACKCACFDVYRQHQVIFNQRRLRNFSGLPGYSDNALGFVSRCLCLSSLSRPSRPFQARAVRFLSLGADSRSSRVN